MVRVAGLVFYLDEHERVCSPTERLPRPDPPTIAAIAKLLLASGLLTAWGRSKLIDYCALECLSMNLRLHHFPRGRSPVNQPHIRCHLLSPLPAHKTGMGERLLHGDCNHLAELTIAHPQN